MLIFSSLSGLFINSTIFAAASDGNAGQRTAFFSVFEEIGHAGLIVCDQTKAGSHVFKMLVGISRRTDESDADIRVTIDFGQAVHIAEDSQIDNDAVQSIP